MAEVWGSRLRWPKTSWDAGGTVRGWGRTRWPRNGELTATLGGRPELLERSAEPCGPGGRCCHSAAAPHPSIPLTPHIRGSFPHRPHLTDARPEVPAMRRIGAEAGSEGRQGNQGPGEQREGLGAWGAGHRRSSCPRRGPCSQGTWAAGAASRGGGATFGQPGSWGKGEGGEGIAASQQVHAGVGVRGAQGDPTGFRGGMTQARHPVRGAGRGGGQRNRRRLRNLPGGPAGWGVKVLPEQEAGLDPA